MKRALLIAGGTMGGLGAVLAITPPQLNSTELALPSGNEAGNTASGASTQTTLSSSSSNSPAPTASSSASKSATTNAKSSGATAPSKSANSTSNSQSGSSTSQNATSNSSAASSNTTSSSTSQSTQSAQTTTPSKSAVSGDFLGTAVNVGYGIVQVKITVENGKITDAVAVQAPSGRNDRFTSYAIPILKKQTLAAQSDAISGASGASYTSYGWYKSLQSALTKAGML